MALGRGGSSPSFRILPDSILLDVMAIDLSKLQVSVAESERWRRTVSITVPREVVETERRAAVKAFSSRLRLPGFRAGKVPPGVVEKRFGPALDQELVDRVIGDVYRRVLEDREMQPISEGEVGDVQYRPESDLSFAVSFDVAPRIELARLGGFRVERPEIPITEGEVEGVLGRVREREGTWVPVEGRSPASGERVEVRIQRLEEKDAQPRAYEFRLGGGEAIADVEGAIQSLEPGTSGEFTIEFPEDSAPGAEPGEPSSRARSLRITLDSVKRLELPELDDEFARATGEFEDLADMRARIREDLEKEAAREAEARLRDALIEQILSANSFDVPESMVERFIRAALGNPKELAEERWEEAKRELRPGAVAGVRRHLVVTRIAETEGLTATPSDVDARIETMAKRGGVSPADVYSRLQRAGQIERLEREVTEDKVFEFLKEKSEIR